MEAISGVSPVAREISSGWRLPSSNLKSPVQSDDDSYDLLVEQGVPIVRGKRRDIGAPPDVFDEAPEDARQALEYVIRSVIRGADVSTQVPPASMASGAETIRMHVSAAGDRHLQTIKELLAKTGGSGLPQEKEKWRALLKVAAENPLKFMIEVSASAEGLSGTTTDGKSLWEIMQTALAFSKSPLDDMLGLFKFRPGEAIPTIRLLQKAASQALRYASDQSAIRVLLERLENLQSIYTIVEFSKDVVENMKKKGVFLDVDKVLEVVQKQLKSCQWLQSDAVLRDCKAQLPPGLRENESVQQTWLAAMLRIFDALMDSTRRASIQEAYTTAIASAG